MTIKLIPIGNKDIIRNELPKNSFILSKTLPYGINVDKVLTSSFTFIKTLNWKKVVLIIVISIISFIILQFIYKLLTASDPNSKQLLTYKNSKKLQTGDLVFASYNNFLGYFMRGLTGSIWTHVGMIMKYKDKLYVMETADYSSAKNRKIKENKDHHKMPKNLKYNGIIVVPFETWNALNYNCKTSYLKLDTPVNWDRRQLIQEFLKIQESEADKFSVGPKVWMKVLRKQKYKSNSSESEENITSKRENITCSELITKIYQNSGVMKKIYTPGSYSTGDIIGKKIEMEKGFRLI